MVVPNSDCGRSAIGGDLIAVVTLWAQEVARVAANISIDQDVIVARLKTRKLVRPIGICEEASNGNTIAEQCDIDTLEGRLLCVLHAVKIQIVEHNAGRAANGRQGQVHAHGPSVDGLTIPTSDSGRSAIRKDLVAVASRIPSAEDVVAVAANIVADQDVVLARPQTRELVLPIGIR